MKIPEKIQIFGRNINIRYDNKLCDEKNIYGESRFTENEILISDIVSGIKRDIDGLSVTLMHEIMHWIFYVLEYNDLKENEKLVSQLAEILYQVIKQLENDKKM